jgi:hypothetical protein
VICDRPASRSEATAAVKEMRQVRSDCRDARRMSDEASKAARKKARSASSGLSFHASFLSFTRSKPLAYQ